MKPHYIIKRPILTEKGTKQKDGDGEEKQTKVYFEVESSANKTEVRQAIESLFSVKVSAVHTQIVRGKEKRVGRFIGRRSNWKKAIITLAPGQSIEFFEGV